MTQDINNRHFMADENKIFIRLSDNVKVGHELYLAEVDSIENYSEVDMDEEDKVWFASLKRDREIHHEDMKEHKKNRK